MFMNVGFVAREYIQDDEIVDSRDGLSDHFGGDNYCITRNVGLAYGDDGCEPCLNEEKPRDMNRYITLTNSDDLSHEEIKLTKEAVASALALQKHFQRRQKTKEEKVDTLLLIENEPEVKERAVPIRRHYSSTGFNHRGMLRMKVDHKTHEIIRTYFSQGQRCYGGQDNRRLRRNDDTGKVIGHNHRRRHYDHDIGRVEFHPVAIVFNDGTALRVA